MKKLCFLTAVLLMLSLLACSSIALAAEDVPPPDQIAEGLTYSVVDWHMSIMPYADELKLTRKTASIYKVDSTHITVRGVTEANKTCWLIGGQLIVQQWKNNKWNNYHTTTFTDRGTYKTEGINKVTVASGYYYRLVVDHNAHYSDEVVYGTTQTKSVLVD